MIDVIIVGSGASAVHAAYPLVKAGRRVLMLDAGAQDERYAQGIAKRSFSELRSGDADQHRYFLGDDFEGIPEGPVRVGAQLTPPRQHIARLAESLLPLHAPEFHAMQTLALGGLAAGWGATAPPFIDEDLRGWPITRADLQPHYDTVARRVGICGVANDDLAPFFGPSPHLLPPAQTDSNGRAMLRSYEKHKPELNAEEFHAGHPRLAIATRPFRGRGPLRYDDLEFWADNDRAVYRPVYTLEELKHYTNFEYRGGLIVEKFEETERGDVSVHARAVTGGGAAALFVARKLILAAGTLGTTRITLQSLGATSQSVPLVSNPYTYYPCLLWKRLGQCTRDRRHSLTQAMMYFRPSANAAVLQAQAYSYRSLLTFKLVKESPLPHRETIRLMQALQSYFVIIGVHHEDHPTPQKSMRLRGDGVMEIDYAPTAQAMRARLKNERKLMRCVRDLGCWPLRRIDPGEGSSIHYAGSLPMTNEDRPLTTTPAGLLRGTGNVYIADGAAFPNLPAKGLTYTLMANACRVGGGLVKDLQGGNE
ncbi:hypothetical protein BH09SUM1_BH09SUM1_15460 [soil metagenome]